MKTTTNYSLKKPELNDYVNVNDLNDNADKIDTELKKISDAIGNLPDLNTNEKTALVLSINELLTKIGNTSSLTTDKKNNLVDALNELKQHLTAHLADDAKHITEEERNRWNDAATQFSVYKSGKDENGVFTIVEYKRADGTLYARSVLSGGTSPQYTTRTITYYAADGTTVIRTDPYTLIYDADGDLIGEVKQ